MRVTRRLKTDTAALAKPAAIDAANAQADSAALALERLEVLGKMTWCISIFGLTHYYYDYLPNTTGDTSVAPRCATPRSLR